MGAGLRSARRGATGGALGATAGASIGIGVAADKAGAVVGAGAGAAARALDGGSNSKVYSRTNRPVGQLISRITSTNGSCTPRSLVKRR